MNNSYLKTVVLALVVMLIATTVPVLTPQAQAVDIGTVVGEVGVTGGLAMGACLAGAALQELVSMFTGEVLFSEAVGILTAGLDVPTDDNKHQIDDIVRNCFNYVKEFIVEALKRQLLNNLTNEVVRWIQGDGDPRFVSDPLGFMGNTVESAMGKTLQDIGLADNTCAPAYQVNLRVRMEKLLEARGRSFASETSCTLGEFLGNAGDGSVNIGGFASDFRQGSWPAWNRLFSGMENNQFGAQAMGALELSANIAGATYEADLETRIGDGFLGEKVCLQWRNNNTGQTESSPGTRQKPPDAEELPGNVKFTGNDASPGKSEWTCVQDQTITPGQTMANVVADSVGSEFDRIVNADELAGILGAIFDALIGRIVGDGLGEENGFFDSTGLLFNVDNDNAVEGVTDDNNVSN